MVLIYKKYDKLSVHRNMSVFNGIDYTIYNAIAIDNT